MAFFRRRGNSLTLIHGMRTETGVRQRVLHTFSNLVELRRLLEIGGWPKFCMEMEQKFPDVAPDWEDVQRQALALQETISEIDVEPLDRLDKLRRALAFAGRELARLNPEHEEHRQAALALGPELKDCLYFGHIVLESVRGRPREESLEMAQLVIPNADAVSGLMDEAERALRQRNWKRAAKLFAEARRYDPFDPDTINSEGIGWMGRRKWEEARDCFERARDLAFRQLPKGDRVYSWQNLRARPYLRATYNLALVSQQENDYPRALELLQECLQRCPDDGVSARFIIGNLHHRLGQFETALRYYKQFIEGNQMLPDPYFDGASLLVEMGRGREALEWGLLGLARNHWFPRVLGRQFKVSPGGLNTADSWEWACDYVAKNGDLWTQSALAFLRRLVKAEPVRSLLTDIVDIDELLEDLEPSPRRSELVHQLIERRAQLTEPKTVSRVATALELG